LGYSTHCLVGGFNPSEKYQSMGRIIPYIMEKNMFQATNQKVFITANRTAIKKFLLPEASTCSPSWLVESPIIMLGSMAQNVGKYKVMVPKSENHPTCEP